MRNFKRNNLKDEERNIYNALFNANFNINNF